MESKERGVKRRTRIWFAVAVSCILVAWVVSPARRGFHRLCKHDGPVVWVLCCEKEGKVVSFNAGRNNWDGELIPSSTNEVVVSDVRTRREEHRVDVTWARGAVGVYPYSSQAALLHDDESGALKLVELATANIVDRGRIEDSKLLWPFPGCGKIVCLYAGLKMSILDVATLSEVTSFTVSSPVRRVLANPGDHELVLHCDDWLTTGRAIWGNHLELVSLDPPGLVRNTLHQKGTLGRIDCYSPALQALLCVGKATCLTDFTSSASHPIAGVPSFEAADRPAISDNGRYAAVVGRIKSDKPYWLGLIDLKERRVVSSCSFRPSLFCSPPYLYSVGCWNDGKGAVLGTDDGEVWLWKP